jgi:hypothetical protein
MKPSNNSSVPDLYVTTSSGGSSAIALRAPIDPPGVSNRANVLFWRDRRIQ